MTTSFLETLQEGIWTQKYMWQSRAEINHYSVTYFDHFTTSEVL